MSREYLLWITSHWDEAEIISFNHLDLMSRNYTTEDVLRITPKQNALQSLKCLSIICWMKQFDMHCAETSIKWI